MKEVFPRIMTEILHNVALKQNSYPRSMSLNCVKNRVNECLVAYKFCPTEMAVNDDIDPCDIVDAEVTEQRL